MNVEPNGLSAELRLAYSDTDYRVDDNGCQFTLRVNERSVSLLECYATHRVQSAAYLTAWNPRSEPTPGEGNAAAQARLESEVKAAGWMFLRGQGVDPHGRWPAEPSILVLGMGAEQASALGRAYQQNALVFAGADAIARLVTLV
ncbi:MAG TPA: DUF3293 domain-containing protein [Steroidobacteraceae bacterium]|nr:DUF3293 domain-containing protein [Steroidobacteraceae bacterium]